MSKPTLLILAAGMGSRYGGLKQMDPVGPSGEIVLDYSIFDALRAGFGRVVFVIRRDIEKTKEKISEQQKRLRALEAQLTEEENLEIVRMVKAVKMDNRELTAFLKAYASGLITLPEGMMEAEAAADPGEEDMEDHENEE